MSESEIRVLEETIRRLDDHTYLISEALGRTFDDDDVELYKDQLKSNKKKRKIAMKRLEREKKFL